MIARCGPPRGPRRWLLLALALAAFIGGVVLLAPRSRAAPPYTSNTSGVTLNGVLEALTDQNTGATPVTLITAATTNCASVKASAGTLYSLSASSTDTLSNFVKFYDIATTPLATSTTVKLQLGVPANASGVHVPNSLPQVGVNFDNGIGICVTRGYAADDNNAATAGVTVTYSYK